MLCREGPWGDNQPDLPPFLPISPAGAPHNQTYLEARGVQGPPDVDDMVSHLGARSKGTGGARIWRGTLGTPSAGEVPL